MKVQKRMWWIYFLKIYRKLVNPFFATYVEYIWTLCTNEDICILNCHSLARTAHKLFIILTHTWTMFNVSQREHLTVCILWNYWKFCFPAVESSHESWKLRKVQPFSVAGFWLCVCSQNRHFLVSKPFSAGEKSSYYMMKGNDNWNLCWRLLIYPLPLLLLKTQKPWPPSLVLPLHWKCNHFWLWQIFKMTLSVTSHLWGQKQFDPPKISKISSSLFFFFFSKK